MGIAQAPASFEEQGWFSWFSSSLHSQEPLVGGVIPWMIYHCWITGPPVLTSASSRVSILRTEPSVVGLLFCDGATLTLALKTWGKSQCCQMIKAGIVIVSKRKWWASLAVYVAVDLRYFLSSVSHFTLQGSDIDFPLTESVSAALGKLIYSEMCCFCPGVTRYRKFNLTSPLLCLLRSRLL